MSLLTIEPAPTGEEITGLETGLTTAPTSAGFSWVSRGAQGVALGAALIFAGTGTGTATAFPPGDVVAPRLTPAHAQTSSGSQFESQSPEREVAPVRTDRDDIRWIHQASGLTWEQLGRIFGVSRRAVHMWANGSRMNSANAETLAALVRAVKAAPTLDADACRTWLLRPGSDGRSEIDHIRERRSNVFRINQPSLRAADTVDTPTDLAVTES